MRATGSWCIPHSAIARFGHSACCRGLTKEMKRITGAVHFAWFGAFRPIGGRVETHHSGLDAVVYRGAPASGMG
jgi:hypothetical protein